MPNNEENNKKSAINLDQPTFQKKLGIFLTSLRKASGYDNAYDFAIAINITESQYGSYERGEKDMRLNTLRKILLGNNVRIEELLNLDTFDDKDPDSELTLKGKNRRIEQVREQVDTLNGAATSIKLSDNDLDRIIKILIHCVRPHSKKEILDRLNLANTMNNFIRVAGLAEQNGWIAKTNPNNPNSPKQQYYTTEKGKSLLILSH